MLCSFSERTEVRLFMSPTSKLEEVYVHIHIYEGNIEKVDVFLDEEHADRIYYQNLRDFLENLEKDDWKHLGIKNLADIRNASQHQLIGWYMNEMDYAGGMVENEYRLFTIKPHYKDEEQNEGG